MEFKDLIASVQSATQAMRDSAVRMDEETRKFGEATAETKAQYEKQNARIDELELEIKRMSLVPVNAPDNGGKHKAWTAAFGKMIRYGCAALTPDEQKALVEDTTGQYIVEPELDAEIQRSLPKITVMRNLATIRTVGSDRLKMRSIGEVSVGWGKLETGTDITESTPTPGAPTYQYVEDIYGLAKIGEDELADTDVNLVSLLADEFTRAVGEAEDKGYFVGTGHTYQQPEGVTVNATLVAATKTTAAANAVTVEDLLDVIYACPAQFRKNASWVFNSTLELAIRKLRAGGSTAGDGAFLWQPSVAEGRPNTLCGYPVYNQDDMSDLSGVQGVIAAFGDFRAGYRIVDREGMTIQRMGELYSEAGLIGFRVRKRTTGGVINAARKPIVLLTERS
jgi:HK97 family phage major capsid protein